MESITIFVERKPSGLLLSTITDCGEYFKRLYIDHTEYEAKVMFRNYVREQLEEISIFTNQEG